MGKASSSKKVARAARAGGSAGPKQRKLAFPLAIVAIVVLGVGLVVFARTDYTSAQATAPVANEDHWHSAYGVYVCDAFQTPIDDAGQDTTGIHTHGDGIIHIHPFQAASGGKNATLDKWGEVVGMDFGSDSITLQDGTELTNGFDCAGDTDTEVGIWVWNVDEPDGEPTVYRDDFGSIRFDANRQAFTIAVVPTGTTPPRPETEDDIDRLDPTTDEVLPEGVDPSAGTDIAPLDPGATTDSSVAVDPNAAAEADTSTTVAP